MRLIDEANILVESGAGGNGCISFRREKYVPFGGPNGGNGGRGGNVIFRATHDKGSLLDFKFRPKFAAGRGEHGMGSDCDGAGGEDLLVLVPMGTRIYDRQTDELICDLVKDGDTILVAKGGRGGRGNLSYKSSTNRAPRESTPGEAGEIRELRMELRLIADVGLIGMPNAGKSSFLRVVSRATPKVADYPFTTLDPNLGVVAWRDRSRIFADLPGLIEGASQGAGLGIKFLKHATRTRILLHFVECHVGVDEIENRLKTIRKELEEYDSELGERDELVVLTKADLLDDEHKAQLLADLKTRGIEAFIVSSHSGYGMPELMNAIDDLAPPERISEPPVDSSAVSVGTSA